MSGIRIDTERYPVGLVIKDCTFSEGSGVGIRIDTPSNVMIRDCRFVDLELEEVSKMSREELEARRGSGTPADVCRQPPSEPGA